MKFLFFQERREVLQSSNPHLPRIRPWFRRTLRVLAALCAQVSCSVFSPSRLQYRNAQHEPLPIFCHANLFWITSNPSWVVYTSVLFFNLQVLKGGSAFTTFVQLSSFQHCGCFRLLVFTSREVLRFLVRALGRGLPPQWKRETRYKKTFSQWPEFDRHKNYRVMNLIKSLAGVRLLNEPKSWTVLI